jgi:hypothetical protein
VAQHGKIEQVVAFHRHTQVVVSELFQERAMGAEMKGVDDPRYSFLGDVTAGRDAAHSGAIRTASHRKDPGEEGVLSCREGENTETAQKTDRFLSFGASKWSPSAPDGPLVLTYYPKNRRQALHRVANNVEASFLNHH